MKLPHKTLERKLFQSGYKNIIAVDEVGMGALAGPVVVCAVSFRKEFYAKQHKKLSHLRDSKLLTSYQREKFANELFHVPGFMFHVSYCYPKTIDRLNIYQAARLAMRRVVKRIMQKSKIKNQNYKLKFKNKLHVSSFKFQDSRTIVLVDGKNKINGLDMEQLPIIKGDRKVFAIACASIIAKVYRDKMMLNYAKKYPEYGFEKHKGYGTRFHQARLITFGPSKIHRRSFNPVAKTV
ncbi:MAG: ribonuclease HII [Parcubacteria group bacterium]|nr:ribonuclease HII [Parcubacteria group bacterium]